MRRKTEEEEQEEDILAFNDHIRITAASESRIVAIVDGNSL